MGRARKILRRSFLVGSAAIAGGVVFGVYTVRRPHDNPLLDGLREGEVSFNPWVRIAADGIVLIAPHTDVGQGVRSLQAMLIAEELDLDPGQFAIETGPPAAAYYNTAAADDSVPFRHGDQRVVARAARGVVGAVTKVMGVQATGGSSTVPDSYVKLRTAGAVARETLKLAAARRSGSDVTALSTAAGAVIFPDGERIAYTALATDAAGIEPVNEVTLRDPPDWRLIGREVQRADIVGKSTGTLEYGIDLRMEDMRYASVRFNPRQGGELLGHDASRAQSMPGVEQVIEVTNGVAVVADNTWNAIEAVNAVDCDWGAAPYPPDTAQHWEEISASFTDERLDREWRSDGDVEAALADAGNIELEYRAPHVAHAPLEPLSAVVLVTDARADLWAAHQFPRIAEELVAGITGLHVDDVHLHNQYAGGSFGHRLEFENLRYAAEVAAQMKGTPVKLTFSREEDFAHDFVRQNGICRVRGRVADGRVDTLDIAVAGPAVLSSQFARVGLPSAGPDTQMPAGIWEMPYAIPNLRVSAYRSPELVPTSSWRSVGASTGGFFLETALDELIVAAGADPLEERLRLCDDAIARNVLEAVGEMSNWGSWAADGRGLALVYSFGVYVAEVVDVSNTDRGLRIDRVFVATDVGRVLDPVNFENQVQGGVVWGLGHAMNCEMTYADGIAQQRNFHQHTGMRIHQCPPIEVRALETSPRVLGIGEPPVPPAAPALGNAIYRATGTRLREMPFNRVVRFI